MYHVLEIIIVGMVVSIASYAVLKRYGRPLLQPLRQMAARILMRASAESWAYGVGVRLHVASPATVGCGNGCGDDTACGSCGAANTSSAALMSPPIGRPTSRPISHPIKIVRRQH